MRCLLDMMKPTSYDAHRKIPAILKFSGYARYSIHFTSNGAICTVPGDDDSIGYFWGTRDEIRAMIAWERTALRLNFPNVGAVWAEDQDGLILTGIDPQGNRCEHELIANLDSIRAWHRAHAEGR